MAMTTALLVALAVSLLVLCGAGGAMVYNRYGMMGGVIPLLAGILAFALLALALGA